MAYEVDFEYFKRFFWKLMLNKLVGYSQLSSHVVWTEIYSNIKGNATCASNYVGAFFG